MTYLQTSFDREVAVYQGDLVIAEGSVRHCAEVLKCTPQTILFYLTKSYQKRLAGRKTIDNSRTVVRLDDDDDEEDF